MKRYFIFILVIINGFILRSQTPEVEMLTSGNGVGIRGLSVVNDNVIWVSGSNGMVGKSNNGGKNWKWIKVNGFEKTDFRDIEAFDANVALIMGISSPARILKTTDGGETWKLVYENKTKGMFLDAMDFNNPAHGLVIGDPMDNKIFIAETNDGGETWNEWDNNKKSVADSGEAFFAASGTNIRVFDKNKFFIVSGGLKSRLFSHSGTTSLPFIQGKETAGANSIAVYDAGKKKGSSKMIVVGGDFNADSSAINNCFLTEDGGKNWIAPQTPTHGYRSCVEFLSKKDILSCGLNGVDFSSNGGKTWQWISKEGFNVCRIAKYGKTVFLAGGNGKVAKIVWKLN